MLDDDPDMRGMQTRGVKVVGDRYDMERVAAEYRASAIVIAVPSANSSVVLELSELATKAGLSVRVLPSVRELLDGRVRVVDIREPTERDLLGRHPIETDLEQAASYLRGKRVVVTGAGGSIGSELCRQIAQFEPAELIMIDRDESALHAVQLSIEGRALLDTPDLVLLDIRDRERVKQLFCERRPDVVFHAAALKHLPLLESHPVEALKTNVWGTLAVLEAAEAVGRRALRQHLDRQGRRPVQHARLLEARRRGSHRRRRRASRGPLPLGAVRQRARQPRLGAHHVPEAARARRSAHGDPPRRDPLLHDGRRGGAAGRAGRRASATGGEVLVLDMGEPVHIADVAEQLARTVKPPCPIEFVGLRHGEKMHEELFGDSEAHVETAHPLIRSVGVPALHGDCVRHFPATISNERAADALIELCERMRLELDVIDLDQLPYNWGAVAGGS